MKLHITLFSGLDEVYTTMMNMQDLQRRIYHSCLTTLQIDFVKSVPGSVKEVIRLVKYWKAEYLKKHWTGQSRNIPTSYCFELLTILAWEKAGKPDPLDLGQGFKRVMTMAKDLDTLKHYWTENYSGETAERGIASNNCKRYKTR